MMASESPMGSFDPHDFDIGQPLGSTAAAESSKPPAPVSPPRPWGPWATIGWTVLCIVVMFAVQIVVAIIVVAFRFALNPKARLFDLATDSNLVAVCTLVSTPALVGLIAFLISIRRYPIREIAAFGLYLGLVRYQTGSVLVTMLLHAVANAVATAEVVIQTAWLK
jgi:membrane protease YdiL (CAAX protease family)